MPIDGGNQGNLDGTSEDGGNQGNPGGASEDGGNQDNPEGTSADGVSGREKYTFPLLLSVAFSFLFWFASTFEFAYFLRVFYKNGQYFYLYKKIVGIVSELRRQTLSLKALYKYHLVFTIRLNNK